MHSNYNSRRIRKRAFVSCMVSAQLLRDWMQCMHASPFPTEISVHLRSFVEHVECHISIVNVEFVSNQHVLATTNE